MEIFLSTLKTDGLMDLLCPMPLQCFDCELTCTLLTSICQHKEALVPVGEPADLQNFADSYALQRLDGWG